MTSEYRYKLFLSFFLVLVIRYLQNSDNQTMLELTSYLYSTNVSNTIEFSLDDLKKFWIDLVNCFVFFFFLLFNLETVSLNKKKKHALFLIFYNLKFSINKKCFFGKIFLFIKRNRLFFFYRKLINKT